MARFSHRIGATKPPELALQAAPAELRIALWNVFEPPLFSGEREYWQRRLKVVYPFLHWRSHEVPFNANEGRNRLEVWFFACEWYAVYDFCEFVADLLARERVGPEIFDHLNKILQAEGSPYRFINGQLTLITDEREIEAVRAALAAADRFAGAREHLTTALNLLGHRPQPDFRNTIKESISAVESTLKVITGHDHADLSEALQEFVKTHPIHGALFRGLTSLYGYTSNEYGLRHGLLDAEANVDFAEAKFMVVACSAFVSYLITRAGRPG